jgi:hypothetical protein
MFGRQHRGNFYSNTAFFSEEFLLVMKKGTLWITSLYFLEINLPKSQVSITDQVQIDS